MVKNLLIALLFCSSFTCAETIKTDVLIIGSTASGAAAAIQCARSKVKTMLLMPGGWLADLPRGNNYTVTSNLDLPSGLWGEYREKMIAFYKGTTGYDANLGVTLKFDSSTGADILKKIADTVKNLSIKLNTPFTTLKKDGTGWEITVTENGQTNTIKTRVLIDATRNGDVVIKAGASFPPTPDRLRSDNGYLYRTAIAVSDVLPGYYIPMRDVVVRNADNLLLTEKILSLNKDIQSLPLQMELGQGVGAMAAFVIFFKTTTKNLRVRLIQQELLDFKAYLQPFVDIKNTNRYIRAVQQIGATGMLKGKAVNGGLLFMPDSLVNTSEISPVITEIYSRAFLWFNKEKPAEKFTVGNTLSLISEITLSEPQTLQITMKSDWKAKYNFVTPFDPDKPITRMEFAILINKYLNPFARTVDLAGNVVN